jgi:hypothetical protein
MLVGQPAPAQWFHQLSHSIPMGFIRVLLFLLQKLHRLQ